MNCKIIREGNAFYETDDQCMKKKKNQKLNSNTSNQIKNTASRKQTNIFFGNFHI